MTWWRCAVCDADTVCAHREPELVTWMLRQQRRAWLAERERYRRELEVLRMPAARETGDAAPLDRRRAV